jgi:hypothetical protein
VSDRITRYAKAYGVIAQLQASFAQVLVSHGIDAGAETFEADMLVDHDVAQRAGKRAAAEGLDLAVLSRALLFQAAAEAVPDPLYDRTRRPPFRSHGSEGQSRLRFWVPRDAYDEAKAAILASRRSVAHALEDKLRAYIREGLG